MAAPKISIGSVANLFTRMMWFEKAGDTEEGHAHRFAHLTLLTKGALKVIVNGQETEFDAPYQIYIEKDLQHTLIALEDDTLAFCIHALRDGDAVGDIIDPESVPKGVSVMSLALPVTVSPTEEPNVRPANIRRRFFK